MKKFLIANKKLSFALVAGILTTAIALGGIFAWFTATAGVNEGAVDTAQVGVELANNGSAFLYEWTYTGLALQREFIAGINAKATLAGKAEYIKEFFATYDSEYLYSAEESDDPWTSRLYLTDSYAFDDPDLGLFKVTPGTFIDYSVRYVNTSNIPVYMRFKAPAISAWKDSLPPAELPVYIHGKVSFDGQTLESIDFAYVDGYYYYTRPLGIKDDVLDYDPDLDMETIAEYGDREAYINLKAYVDHNLAGYQGGAIDFGGVEVEVIQATNNAAYLAWGVDDVVFEPYVAP